MNEATRTTGRPRKNAEFAGIIPETPARFNENTGKNRPEGEKLHTIYKLFTARTYPAVAKGRGVW